MIKWLAVLLMVVDHVGFFLFPEQIILRAIGRLSFPLFAFLIANGYQYTKDKKKYLLRLFVFANIIQLPSLFMSLPFNIFYTLSLGLVCIMIFESNRSDIQKILGIIVMILIASVVNADYGVYGMVIILLVHVFKEKYMLMAISILLLSAAYYGLTHIQTLAALSPGIMYFYNNKKGRGMKYFFYLFYPVHMVLLDWLSRYI
jgi:hypothetical protein